MTMPRRHVARQAVTALPLMRLGEGPVWDGPRDRLLWVDIPEGTVFEGDLLGDEVRLRATHVIPGTVGAVVPAGDGGRVVAGPRRLVLVGPDGRTSDGVELIPGTVRSRLNDAGCDPAGRLLVGSLSLDGRAGEESLFSVAADGRVSIVVTGLTLSNGLAFSPDGSVLYLVDSVPGVVWAFDYDIEAGTCSGRRAIWQGTDGIPDGLTVDADGRLWVAFYGAGEVRCLSPDGEVLAIVEVPAPKTTCPAFVGTGLDRLLITTAREKLDDAQLARWPASGALFLADVGATGLPAVPWAGSTVQQTGPRQPSSRTEETPQ